MILTRIKIGFLSSSVESVVGQSIFKLEEMSKLMKSINHDVTEFDDKTGRPVLQAVSRSDHGCLR